MDARGVRTVVEGCRRLRDLRAGEITGFDDADVAVALFPHQPASETGARRLQRPQRQRPAPHGARARPRGGHPDGPPRGAARAGCATSTLSRCAGLTSQGVAALGHCVPDLEGLQLSGCTSLTDAALEPILASTPRLDATSSSRTSRT